jgi:hypothetical protein
MYHDPKLMLEVYRMVQAGFSYRATARKLGVTKDKVARIMKQFKKGRVKIENGRVVRVMKPTVREKTHVSGQSLLLQIAKAQGAFRQKYCRELKANGTCTLMYKEPIKEAPVEWINEGSHVRMKPTRLWCAFCPYFQQR